MSKKLISILLVFSMVFCFSACGGIRENGKINILHTHRFSDVTCTSARKCSCGATTGVALGHDFAAATCTSPEICSRCGIENGHELGHDYVNNKCSRCEKDDPESLPVWLHELFLIDSYNYEYKTGNFTDSFGNIYDGVHYYSGLFQANNGRQPRSEFNLNNKYTYFTGSIVASTQTSSEWTYYINIYVDGVLKFSKTGFSKTSGKVDFKIDVKNASTLKITAGKEGHLGGKDQEIGIVNAQLIK